MRVEMRRGFVSRIGKSCTYFSRRDSLGFGPMHWFHHRQNSAEEFRDVGLQRGYRSLVQGTLTAERELMTPPYDIANIGPHLLTLYYHLLGKERVDYSNLTSHVY